MTKEASLVGYTKGEALAFSEASAFTYWRKMHAASKSTEQAWLDDVDRVETKVRSFHGGRVQMCVTIEARKAYNRETFIFGWEPHEHGGWQLEYTQ